MRNLWIVFFGIALSVVPVAAFSADTVFVKETTGVGPTASELQVATELIRNAVTQVKGFQLSSEEKKAEVTLQPKLLRLETTLMLTIQKLKNDHVVTSQQIKVSDLDELDLVSLRLTRAVLEGTPVLESGGIDEVTRSEQHVMGRRKDAARNWVIGFGPHVAGSMDSDASLFNFHLGYSWLVKPQSEIKLFWDNSSASGGSSVSLSYLGIGYTHLLSSSDQSLFFAGEMGHGRASYTLGSLASAPSESVWGFVAGGGVGYRFFRTSRINLDMQLRAATTFGSGRFGHPSVYGFRLSLYF